MSKTIKIQIIGDYQDYKKGQIVELDEKAANTLLTNSKAFRIHRKTGKSEESSDESSESEELDITDLVNSQKSIENKQQEYFDMMFKQIENMQSKLNDMDSVFEKLNSMEEKIEKYRPKTAQEKLELRSLDSGPFNQKLSSFFDDKQEDMNKSGKNEYVLTSDEVEQIVPSEIKKTFDNYGMEPTGTSFKMG